MEDEDQNKLPPRKKTKLSFTEYIEVMVGSEASFFSVHKNIICARSPFFEAACSSRWQTSGSGVIELPEDDAHIFDIYLHCVYHNSVDVGDVSYALSGESEWSHEHRAYMRLTKAYILADKLGDIPSTNMLINEIIRCSDVQNTLPARQCAALVAEHTMTGSSLHLLFVDYCVHEADLDSLQRLCKDVTVPVSLKTSVLEEQTRFARGNKGQVMRNVFMGNFTSEHKCKYHQHSERYPHCGTGCEKVIEIKDD